MTKKQKIFWCLVILAVLIWIFFKKGYNSNYWVRTSAREKSTKKGCVCGFGAKGKLITCEGKEGTDGKHNCDCCK